MFAAVRKPRSNQRFSTVGRIYVFTRVRQNPGGVRGFFPRVSRTVCRRDGAFMIDRKKVTVVLPAYNAARTLQRTFEEIPKDVVDDIILTDDASSDETVEIARKLGIYTLGPVDSKDSLLSANQIQGCFWGGGLGCDGSFGFERRCLGADGAPYYRSA